ncbi:MAG: hypothetical protein FWC65_01905 [Treponema sp.]|nr:hypothetical protein [Treponema sp.]
MKHQTNSSKKTAKKTALLAVLAACILFGGLAACDDFFSGGMGEPRHYRAENIDVTVGNVGKWLDRVVGNPALARQVTVAIQKKLSDPGLTSRDRAIFQSYGIKIAVESSNIGVALLSNALAPLADMADRLDDLTADEMEQLLKGVFRGVQSDFRRAGGVGAAQAIAGFAKADVDYVRVNGNTPMFAPGSYFAEEASPSEIAQAILVLTLAKVETSDIDINEWDSFDLEILDIGLNLNPKGDRIVIDGDPEPEALVLAAYLNLVMEDDRFEDHFFTRFIREAFFNA